MSIIEVIDTSSIKHNTYESGDILIMEGKTVYVDSVYGSDSTGARQSKFKPFLTIAAALAVAQSGDVVLIGSGTYNLSSGITIPNGVSVRGVSLGSVLIQMLGVTGVTTLVTMGENSRLEDVALKLTSSGHHVLTGVLSPGTTSATAKLRSATVLVDNSGAGTGTSNVTGILVQSTGMPARETNALRALTCTVSSSGSGVKRALLMNTSVGNFFSRDSNFVAHGGTDVIAIEINIAGGLIGIVTGVADGDVADVSQTAGSLELGQIDLVHSNANGKGFTATQISFSIVWADPGGIATGTRYYRPGSAAMTATEIKLNVPRKAVVKKLHVRSLTASGAGKTDTWTVRKNGIDTALTVSLSGATQLIATIDTVSVNFAANDDISLKVVGSSGSATSDTVCVVETY